MKLGKKFVVGEKILMPMPYGFKEVTITSADADSLEVELSYPGGVHERRRFPVHLSEMRGHCGDQCVTWGIWDGFPHVGYATNSVKGGVRA